MPSLDFPCSRHETDYTGETRFLTDRRRRRGAIFLAAFGLDRRALAAEPPAIAAHLSGPANDAVARNYEGDDVARAGAGHRTGRARGADGGRDLSVRREAPVRNRLQITPDPHLKRRRPDVQRQIQMRGCSPLRWPDSASTQRRNSGW